MSKSRHSLFRKRAVQAAAITTPSTRATATTQALTIHDLLQLRDVSRRVGNSFWSAYTTGEIPERLYGQWQRLNEVIQDAVDRQRKADRHKRQGEQR